MKIFTLCIFTLLFGNSCLSLLLSESIRKSKEVSKEWQSAELKGQFCGTISKTGQNYKRYEFCGFKSDPGRVLEIWLPEDSEKSALVFDHRRYKLERSVIALQEVTTYFNGKGSLPAQVDEQLGVPVDVITNEQEVPLLSAENYLERFLAANKKIDLTESTLNGWLLATNISPGIFRPVLTHDISVDGVKYSLDFSDLSYEERSRLAIGVKYSAYLITVPVDIVTTPFILLGVGVAVVFGT
jgi:hypothetical protein